MGTSVIERAFLACVIALASGCASTGREGPLPSSHARLEAYPKDVTEFVQLRFFHGVPYEVASKFRAEDVDQLLAILRNREAGAAWANTVTTLGMIGDPRAAEPLMEFIETGDGRLTPDHYRAKLSALLALGYIANAGTQRRFSVQSNQSAEDSTALEYLKERAYPDVWLKRPVGWSSPFVGSRSVDAEALAEAAILGLALSGQPAAGEVLADIQRRGDVPNALGLARRRALLARDALREHGQIAAVGLYGYYSGGNTGSTSR